MQTSQTSLPSVVALSTAQRVSASVVITTLLTALTPIIWGSTYLVTTEWLPPDRPFTAALIRTLPAGLALVLWQQAGVPRRDWGRLIVLSVLNIGFFQALLFVAAYRLPGGVAAVVGATQPLLVMAFAWAMDRHRPPLVALGSAGIAIGGMALIFATPDVAWDPLGLLAAAAGTGCMALGTFLAGRWRRDVPLLAFTGWQLLIGGLVLAPLTFLLDPPLAHVSPIHVAGFAYLTIFGALLGYPLWFRGIARLSATAVSALGLLSPLTAITLGWGVLGESLSVREVGGMAVVLMAVLLLQWANRPGSARSFPSTPSTYNPFRL